MSARAPLTLALGSLRSWLSQVSPLEVVSLACLLALTYHHRWVMDDATIFFRYVDNWVFLDRGLVFNAGEYVEGFTSPLWILLLAAGRTLSLDYWTLTLWLGLASALATGIACIELNRRLSGGLRSLNLPLALMAGHYGVQTHFTSGLETGLVQLLGVLTALWIVRPQAPLLQVALGVAPLVRPELAVITGCACLMRTYKTRRPPWPLIAAAAIGGGGWLVFRIYYYADLFPNTFYLKAEPNWEQGLNYLGLELAGSWGVLTAVAIAGLLARRKLRGPDVPPLETTRPRTQMLLLAGIMSLWAVRIGGDMAYHRFLAFPFCLACCASAGLLERGLVGAPASIRYAIPMLALLLSVGSFPSQVLDRHPLAPGARSLQWHGIEDAMWHRHHRGLRSSEKRHVEDRELRRAYARARHPDRHRKYAIKAWCRWAFMRFHTHVIHTYGLTDAILARLDTKTRRPGHKNLWSHARDLNAAKRALPKKARGRGAYRRAVEADKAAPWIRRSLPTIELIERKVHNHHKFLDNLRLALTPIPPIPAR